MALQGLISANLYNGRIISDSDSDFLCVEESIPENFKILPVFVSRLKRYTEFDCRAIFKKLVRAIQSFHEAEIVHRDVNIQNVLVQNQVSIHAS